MDPNNTEEKTNIIKAIILIYCRTGATINNIATDYWSITDEHWPMYGKSFSDIKAFLDSISGVYSIQTDAGAYLWFVNSAQSNHIKQLIMEQRSFTRQYRRRYRARAPYELPFRRHFRPRF